MWRCHVITEGCRECEPGASRTLFSANTGIYLMKPVLKSCNAKEPASEVHLIGRVRVRQMHPVHLISVSLMGGSARTESPEGPALIYLCLKSQARTSQALYTSVTFHLAQHCGKKKKKRQPCLNSLTGGIALPTALFSLLLVRTIRRATCRSRSCNHLCSRS